MNTRIDYQCRDAANYKVRGYCVVRQIMGSCARFGKGVLPIAKLTSAMIDGSPL